MRYRTDWLKTLSLAVLTLIVLFSPQLVPARAAEPMIVTYRAPEDVGDTRYEFDNKLLKLALDKTVPTDGPYELKASPVMNFERAINELETNRLPNFMVKLSYEDRFQAKMGYVPVPTDRGIVGYRAFFVAPEKKDAIAKAQTLEDLKKFTIVQGSGWSDVEILRRQGFKVVTLPSYPGIFSFVAAGRADLFPRGANELLGEYESYKPKEPKLDYDRSAILYYPLPRFFFTSKANEAAIKRVTKGLEIAWKDGSFVALWKQEYQRSIDFLDMKNRHIIRMNNPLITTLDDGYKKYLYNPE